MKKILFFIGALFCINTLNAETKGGLADSQVEAVQQLIHLYGYRCDSVNYASRSAWDGSIRVTCNESKYVYELKDVGGNWTVKVK